MATSGEIRQKDDDRNAAWMRRFVACTPITIRNVAVIFRRGEPAWTPRIAYEDGYTPNPLPLEDQDEVS